MNINKYNWIIFPESSSLLLTLLFSSSFSFWVSSLSQFWVLSLSSFCFSSSFSGIVISSSVTDGVIISSLRQVISLI